MGKHLTPRQIRKRARKVGMTPEGYVYWKTGGQRELAGRTPGALKKQATSEINIAYKPAIEANEKERGRVLALDAKRQADEGAFQSWLQGRIAEIETTAAARDAELTADARNYAGEFVRAANTAADARAAQRAQQGGPGSAPDAVVATTEAADQARVAAQGARFTSGMARVGSYRAQTEANTFANLAARSSERHAKTMDLLSQVASEKDKILISKAGDLAKRVGTLLDNEQTKAQLRLAGEQFGDKLAQDWKKFQQQQKTTNRGITLAHLDRQAALARRDKDKAIDFFNKYGVKPGVFASWDQHKRTRFLKRFKAAGKQGDGSTTDPTKPTPKQIARANDKIASGVATAKGITKPPKYEGDWPPPKFKGPKAASQLALWLQSNLGYGAHFAQLVAISAIYGRPSGTKAGRKRFNQYALTFPN